VGGAAVTGGGTGGGAGVARLVLVGASGRMGQEVLALLPEFPSLRLAGVVVPERHRARAPAGVACESALAPLLASLVGPKARSTVVIDFSVAGNTAATLAACVAAGVPLLLGTTGLDAGMAAAFDRAAATIPLLVSANTSMGVNLLIELVRQAAAALPEQFEIEIVETHHRNKLDAPSGTALALGEAAAQGRGLDLKQAGVRGRHPVAAPRSPGEIGFASVRGGDVVGDHEVRFLGVGERLQLAHQATDRAVFARGALVAGGWLAGQPAGRYRMADVFRKSVSKQ
jgi:4-hydroxy-tetrahydrodipicolinate reductase